MMPVIKPCPSLPIISGTPLNACMAWKMPLKVFITPDAVLVVLLDGSWGSGSAK